MTVRDGMPSRPAGRVRGRPGVSDGGHRMRCSDTLPAGRAARIY